jgi:hypothetical protein
LGGNTNGESAESQEEVNGYNAAAV